MRQTVRRSIGTCGLWLAGCLLTTTAGAQVAGEGLSPTLAAIKSRHTVHLGYRESSPPFSFLDQANRPIGYSLELCEAVVDEISVEVDDPGSQNRIRKSHVRRPHSSGRAGQGRSGMRLDHGQCRTRKTGGVLAADVCGRHQADGAEGLDDLRAEGSARQNGCRHQGHDQRAGHACGGQEVQSRPEHRDGWRSRTVLSDAGGRQGRCVRHRRHPALRSDRAAQVAGQVSRLPAIICPTTPMASCSARASRN